MYIPNLDFIITKIYNKYNGNIFELINPFRKPNITTQVEVHFPTNSYEVDAPESLNGLAINMNP